MRIGAGGRVGLWVFALVVLAFVYVPLAIVTLNSFNSDRTFGWPPPSLTTQWWSAAFNAQGPRDALWMSVKAGLGATAIALALGALLALALTRFDFFGKRVINLLVILPIALPGIVTGVALQSMIQNLLQPVFGINAGLFTIIVGDATFCIVVTFPLLRSSLVAGAVLAFGLSFDEIVVAVVLVLISIWPCLPGACSSTFQPSAAMWSARRAGLDGVTPLSRRART